MSVDKELAKAVKSITTKTDKMIENIIKWIMDNKKKIVVLLVVYLAVRYLFAEQTGDDEDEE